MHARHLFGRSDALSGHDWRIARVPRAECGLSRRDVLRRALLGDHRPHLQDLRGRDLRQGAEHLYLRHQRVEGVRAAGRHVCARHVLFGAQHAARGPHLHGLRARHLLGGEHALAVRVWRRPAHELRAAVTDVPRRNLLRGGVHADDGPRVRSVPRWGADLALPFGFDVHHAAGVVVQRAVKMTSREGEEMYL